jgi:hypothetical protein
MLKREAKGHQDYLKLKKSGMRVWQSRVLPALGVLDEDKT